MKNNPVLMICALCACTLGCQGPRDITIQLRGEVGKPVPVFEKGDTIHWVGPDGNKMSVQFPKGYSPCDTGNDGAPITDCKLTDDQGLYPYHCENCKDPVVPVGRYIGVDFVRARQSSAYYDPLGVYCTDNKTFVPDQVAHPGDDFTWAPSATPGSHTVPTSWKATFTDSGVCAGGSLTFGSDAGLTNHCTVTASANTKYTYKVESNVKDTVCTPYATATLTIQAPEAPAR